MKLTDGRAKIKTKGHLINLMKILRYGIEIERESKCLLTGSEMLF
jgi:hypothetical protein